MKRGCNPKQAAKGFYLLFGISRISEDIISSIYQNLFSETYFNWVVNPTLDTSEIQKYTHLNIHYIQYDVFSTCAYKITHPSFFVHFIVNLSLRQYSETCQLRPPKGLWFGDLNRQDYPDYTGWLKLTIKLEGLKFGGLIGQVVFLARWSLPQVSLYLGNT